ncbi:hypothetical protein JXB01_01955 [Candidatus Micrarchaeota archaeon]|nr:hypothetical protein [Candidatus Micrarchaeota archaeon]
MEDIIKTKENPGEYGFSKFYLYMNVKNKIMEIDSEKKILNYSNKKSVLLLKNLRINSEMIKVAGKRGKVLFLIDLSPLFIEKGIKKAVYLSQIRDFVKLCTKYKAFYSFATFAETKKQIKTIDEIKKELEKAGINSGQAEFALEMLGYYL